MKHAIYTLLAISIGGAPLLAYSDDTEIHLGNSYSDIEPNVIFIMDVSGSMGWEPDSTNSPSNGDPSRLDIVKEIAIDTINDTDNINISLMSFNSNNNQGASVDLPMTPIDSARSNFERIMNNYSAYNGTPITESLDEALRYLRGDDVRYGANGASAAMNATRTKYIKPVKNQCQKNHIILFSDGEPTVDVDSNNSILNKINAINDPRKSELDSLSNDQKCSGNGSLKYGFRSSRYYGVPFRSNGNNYTRRIRRSNGYYYYYYEEKSGICAEELALLAQLESISSDPAVHQNITIHTVGGFVGGPAQEKLKNIAKFGSPEGLVKKDGSGLPQNYYAAEDGDELAEQLKELFNKISDDGSIFTAPSVSVNAFNSLELSDELYYAVFKPSKKADWAGNLKRYRLDLSNKGGTIVGQDDKPAIDKVTGFFKEDAQSFWSEEGQANDGLEVTAGGIAQHLTLPRNIKTTVGGKIVDLTASTFTDDELGIVGKSTGYRNRLLEWAQGIDVDAGPDSNGNPVPRLSIEDPLHSEPTIITYSSNSQTGKKDRTLFLGTNSGYLHAFDVGENSPKEFFSFIPKELIKNLDKYYSGGSFYENKTYGIDGPLTHWHNDTNDNGQVDGNEQVYLYVTLRRGGQSFYALNVTDRKKPELLWAKHGRYPSGLPNIPNMSGGYDKLGQTWARLEPATVLWQGKQRSVLFTAGGYDPIEDGTTSNGPNSRTKHTIGTTVYMIDALTGQVLWDASSHSPSSQMTSSFAANVSPVDTKGDGFANIIFAPDTGGRIWRFDINSQHSTSDLASNFATSTVVADINSGSGAGNRRFFNEIDVVFREKQNDILLSVGSGYRAHPLSLIVTDYHFAIRTSIDKPTSSRVITINDLAEWGDDSGYGWKVPLTHPGEKVLSRSSTTSGAIFFTTFAPKSSNAIDLCSADPGIASLYIMHNKSLRKIRLTQGGIPAMPVVVRKKPSLEEPIEGEPQVQSRSILIGTEVINLMKDPNGANEDIGDEFDHITKDYWLENN